ncbi:uncharacterized protein Bfra_009668 [Botrytis fragariae]|uniref:Uncharacterized protein n=1 Tax=Botrytis fragariae TaxID=1964551 RepID=A0A8H6EFR9_9HELO|nr:uncharacterized protein Bfra_009668 [Botrytis fragariae]KAF5870285.1 hypothetical protein Bfra_009668 [Botrytis fragariae]
MTFLRHITRQRHAAGTGMGHAKRAYHTQKFYQYNKDHLYIAVPVLSTAGLMAFYHRTVEFSFQYHGQQKKDTKAKAAADKRI